MTIWEMRKKDKYKRLNEVTRDWSVGKGIFEYLNTLNVPWKDSGITALQLNLLYYGTWSGNKIIAALLDSMIAANSDLKLTNAQLETLAQSIYALYNPYWQKQYATLFLEYNPIENYSMQETSSRDHDITYGHNVARNETRNDTVSETDNTDRSLTRNETRNETVNETDNTERSLTRNENTKLDVTSTAHDEGTNSNTIDRNETSTASNVATIAGFNSTAYIPDNKADGNSTSAVDETNSVSTSNDANSTVSNIGKNDLTDTENNDRSLNSTGTYTNGGTDTESNDRFLDRTGSFTIGGTDNYTGSDTTTESIELRRSGNIGVTTSQQMLQSERDLWVWNFFTEIVFRNIDSILTCPIY